MTAEPAYFLRQGFIGKIPVLEISESDYETIVRSRGILSAALTIEEKYDLVLGNFIDFERETVLITMDGMTDNSFGYDRAYTILSTLNRKVSNFIYVGKNYTELISSRTSKCVADDDEVASKVQKLTSNLYDTSFEYRFAEALRGHITHYADAVHSVTSPARWSMDKARRADEIEFNIGVYSTKIRLKENTKFKKSVLNEAGEKIDLKQVTRKYMGSISKIQSEVRELVKDSVEKARETIESYTKKYAEINDGDSFGLAAYSSTAIASGATPLSLSLEWDDIRIKLENRNQSIANMDKRFVTSALVRDK